MSLYILDTDQLSLLQRGHPAVQKHYDAHPPDHLAITIVTVEEQLRGRLAQVNKQPSGPLRCEAYERLRKAVADFCKINVLEYDAAADALFLNLKRRFPQLGSQDLRIAAVTLAHQATLVTHNQVDFGKLPELTTEDWTR